MLARLSGMHTFALALCAVAAIVFSVRSGVSNDFMIDPMAREVFLQTVWGVGHGEEVEYLRVFVSQSRNKTELDPAHLQFVVAEPWVECRLAAPRKA